jgi:hypothetical protein
VGLFQLICDSTQETAHTCNMLMWYYMSRQGLTLGLFQLLSWSIYNMSFRRQSCFFPKWDPGKGQTLSKCLSVELSSCYTCVIITSYYSKT